MTDARLKPLLETVRTVEELLAVASRLRHALLEEADRVAHEDGVLIECLTPTAPTTSPKPTLP